MTIEKTIITQIEKTGFQLVTGDTSPFSTILKKNIFFADNIFALIDYKEGQTIKDIISSGKLWISESLGFFGTLFGSGLNIVIFHKGELSANDIKNLCDSVSTLNTILLTITIINVLDNKVEQDRTWILLPTIKRTLANINCFNQIVQPR